MTQTLAPRACVPQTPADRCVRAAPEAPLADAGALCVRDADAGATCVRDAPEAPLADAGATCVRATCLCHVHCAPMLIFIS